VKYTERIFCVLDFLHMHVGARFLVLAVVVGYLTIGGLQLNAHRFADASTPQTTLENSNAFIAAADVSFQATVAWVKSAGYFLMFIAMLVEGPIITAAAAFGAALGYFNIWVVFMLSILGDLVADLLYYAIGHFTRLTVIEKFGHRFGLSTARMKKLEHVLHTHPIKTLLFIKLAPVLPTPGLMIVGAVRMPIAKYVMLSLLITLPKTLLFMALGYYFGAAYDAIAHYAQAGEYFIIAAIAVIVAVYWGYQKGSAAISLRLKMA